MSASVQFSENQVAVGYLTIRRVYADGTKETVLDNDKNVITDASKSHHLSFLYDENAVPDILETFKIGTGGTIDPEGKRPIKPDPKRNDLYQPLTINHNDINIFPSAPGAAQVSITVAFAIAQNEANDEMIDEVALFKRGGDMFNIKTFRAVPKTESFSLEFEWRIVYA